MFLSLNSITVFVQAKFKHISETTFENWSGHYQWPLYAMMHRPQEIGQKTWNTCKVESAISTQPSYSGCWLVWMHKGPEKWLVLTNIPINI